MTSEYQKMIAGEPYHPFDPELRDLAQVSRQKQSAFKQGRRSLKGGGDYQDLVWFDWEKSLCQSTSGGRLWGQYPSRGKFLF